MNLADATIGRRVRSLRDFAGVPAGTEGVIDEDYGSGVTVAWDLPDRPLPEDWTYDPEDPPWAAARGVPLRDGFNKTFELEFLELLDRADLRRDEP